MSKLIRYDPEKKRISFDGDEQYLDCGDGKEGIDPIIPILLKFQAGAYTLQEAYDKYLLYKHKGYL